MFWVDIWDPHKFSSKKKFLVMSASLKRELCQQTQKKKKMEPSYQQTGCVRPASGWETVGEDPCKHLHYLPCLPWGLKSEIFCCCSRGVRAATGSPADWFYSDVKARVWPIDSAQGSPPSFHPLLIHVCLIVPAQSAVQFPITVWPLPCQMC